MKRTLLLSAAAFVVTMYACQKSSSTKTTPTGPTARDTNGSPHVFVDRFSDSAGILFKRSDPANSFPMLNGFPAPNAPINFDNPPFLIHGFDEHHNHVAYYNFDAHKNGVATDILYHFYYEGDTTHRIATQLSIVNSLPGLGVYNDFWQEVKVVVPNTYVINSITSEDEIFASKYQLIPTTNILNCPIVPQGSIASMRVGGGTTALIKGWYKDSLFTYFNFEEGNLHGQISPNGANAPIQNIYVFFAINPNLAGGGPGSGFKVEPNTTQEHNIVPNIPGETGYSSLWSVDVVDNSFFNSVTTVADAKAHLLGENVALVNCPVVALN